MATFQVHFCGFVSLSRNTGGKFNSEVVLTDGKLPFLLQPAVGDVHKHFQTSHYVRISNLSTSRQNACRRLNHPCNSSRKGHRYLTKPVSAFSGLEASTDPKESGIRIKDAKVVLESQDGDTMKMRVDLTGKETDKVFNQVLKDLARTAPPIPGFRREKGGRTSKVPRDFLLQILGEDRVTNFVIREIVSTTMADYAQKENLNVKDQKVSTVETSEELKSSFAPGKEFGFTATLEIENSTTDTASSTSSPQS